MKKVIFKVFKFLTNHNLENLVNPDLEQVLQAQQQHIPGWAYQWGKQILFCAKKKYRGHVHKLSGLFSVSKWTIKIGNQF